MHYPQAKKTAILIVIVYFLLGVFAELTVNGELYPVFSWQLFSRIPSSQHIHTVEIHTIGSTHYDPPLQFSETDFLFTPLQQSPTDYERIVSDLVLAIRENDTESIAQHRTEFEHIFPEEPYEYSIVRVTYDSIEYWKTRTYHVEETLATFTSS